MKKILSAALSLGVVVAATASLHAQNDPTVVGQHADGRPVHAASVVRQASDKPMMMMKRRAKPVLKGMVLFMNNGQLYMMQGSRSLFETNF
jgi:hypothetical protein